MSALGGHHAVQGHLRSLILVPIKRVYAPSYKQIKLTYTLSHARVAVAALTRGCLSLMHSFYVISLYITISHILPTNIDIDLHLCRRGYRSTSINLIRLALKLSYPEQFPSYCRFFSSFRGLLCSWFMRSLFRL